MRTTQGFRLSSWPHSCDSRKEPACRAHKIVRTSDGHPAVTPKRWRDDRAVALRRVNNFLETSLASFQYLSSGDVSNTTTQYDSIWTQFSLLVEAVLSWADPERGQGVRTPTGKSQKYTFLAILVHIMINKFVLPTANKKGSDDRSRGKSQSYTCTKPALHDGPSSVRPRNAI